MGCAVRREQHKEGKHGDDVRGAGNEFVPWVFESFGAMGPQGRALFMRWIRQAEVVSESGCVLTEEEDGWMRAALSAQWQQQFSMTLQRANAQIILGGASRARDLVGQRVYGRRSGGHMDSGA